MYTAWSAGDDCQNKEKWKMSKKFFFSLLFGAIGANFARIPISHQVKQCMSQVEQVVCVLVYTQHVTVVSFWSCVAAMVSVPQGRFWHLGFCFSWCDLRIMVHCFMTAFLFKFFLLGTSSLTSLVRCRSKTCLFKLQTNVKLLQFWCTSWQQLVLKLVLVWL